MLIFLLLFRLTGNGLVIHKFRMPLLVLRSSFAEIQATPINKGIFYLVGLEYQNFYQAVDLYPYCRFTITSKCKEKRAVTSLLLPPSGIRIKRRHGTDTNLNLK